MSWQTSGTCWIRILEKNQGICRFWESLVSLGTQVYRFNKPHPPKMNQVSCAELSVMLWCREETQWDGHDWIKQGLLLEHLARYSYRQTSVLERWRKQGSKNCENLAKFTQRAESGFKCHSDWLKVHTHNLCLRQSQHTAHKWTEDVRSPWPLLPTHAWPCGRHRQVICNLGICFGAVI